MANKNIPAEILFAQHLAANEKVHRDRALRKLQKYLYNHSSLPSGGFNETELLKIWKGLHYCMWMQDKPLIQEELSANIAKLVHSFNNSKTGLLFIKTFYITECREWFTIDKWRMDKFLMLFRDMLTQSLEFLKQKDWNDKLSREFLDFMSSYIILDHEHTNCPDGVRFHLADTYLAELEKVSQGKLGPKQAVLFLQPWMAMLSSIKFKSLRSFVIKNIFGELIQQSPVVSGEPRTKDSKLLRVNYKVVADRLFEIGSSESCAARNRQAVYSLVQNFNDLAQGKLPFSPPKEEEEIPELQEDDIERAVQRLDEFNEELEELEEESEDGHAKGANEALEADEAYGSESSADEEQPMENEQPAKKEPPTMEKSGSKSKKAKKEQPRILSKKLKKLLELEKEFMDEQAEGSDVEEEAATDSTDVTSATSARRASKLKPTSPAVTDEMVLDKVPQKRKVKSKPKEQKLNVPEANGTPAKKSRSLRQTDNEKTTTPDFELEEFPCSAVDISLVAPPPEQPAVAIENKSSKKRKDAKLKSRASKTMNGSSAVGSDLAKFEDGVPAKAKYFKKAMSKSAPTTPRGRECLTPDGKLGKKRISFGKSRSVKKTEVKLKGSTSFDPTKTPEQGILKVNPIQPGTVIQVGKKATLRNTMNNSKFPQRMMASDFF